MFLRHTFYISIIPLSDKGLRFQLLNGIVRKVGGSMRVYVTL